jgi:aryl-alcohol dehydrogenase-like predicted oxidoreductase
VRPAPCTQSRRWRASGRCSREAEIVPAARALGVAIIPCSPLGRGELSGALELAPAGDLRRLFPRFALENRERNRRPLARMHELAAEAGCSPAQLALAWLLYQRADVTPIPGTRRVAHLEENAAAAQVELTAQQVRALDAAFPPGVAAGERYAAPGMATLEH